MFIKNFLSIKICLILVTIQKIFDDLNKKVIGKVKDKFGGVIVHEFVALKSKMYSLTKNDGKECNTAKRVSIAFEFNKFKDVFFNKTFIKHKMKRIESKKHKLGTYEIEKISLSCFDNKRYVLDDRIYTLAYFHKDSITSCKMIQKDCKEIKKDCYKKEKIEKDFNRKDCEKTLCL